MIPSFLITFREALEATIIVAIILTYLTKTKREKYKNIVYFGVSFAIIASIVGAFLFNTFAGGFSGRAAEVFEGTAMLFAAFLITFMILWVAKQNHLAEDLHKKVDREIKEQHKLGLFSLVFISTFREGIETVILVSAASFLSTTEKSLIGAFLGLTIAITIGYLVFIAGKKLNLKMFFSITSIILILFAAGLTAHSIHKLQTADIIPTYVGHVWDINPRVNPDGSYPLLHEEGAIGSLAKGLLGYNGDPSLIETLSYLFYLMFVFILYQKNRIS